jgi:hypothetical protein
MKVIVAYTYELDDIEKAYREISEQLFSGGELLSNSVGIMYCHYEFVLSGVAAELAKRLPFPVVGGSTTLAGINLPAQDIVPRDPRILKRAEDQISDEQFRLAITLLTADDVTFVTAKTPVLTTDSDIKAAVFETIGHLEKPRFVTAFLPTIIFANADAIVRETAIAAKGAPVFGGTSVDDSPTYIENCFVFEGNEAYDDRAVYLLMYGNVHPRFATTTVSEDKYLSNQGVITAAKGREIIEINNKPVTSFLESVGIAISHSPNENVISAVMMIEDKNGNSYGRSMMHLTEQNALMVGGEVTVGDVARIALFEKNGVLGASASLTEKMITENPDASFAIVISCETRHVLLGSEIMDGERMLRLNCGRLPFMLAYAGGEIAPIGMSDDENTVSAVLNQSFCICII